jgi:phosphate-selective porin
VYFQIGAEFFNPPAPANSNYVGTDDFVAIAPCKDLVILQVGQFDAPFTLENRTSDKYFDFIERSLTVRAFGIPTNKEEGAMLHGTNDDRNFYYSAGFFNGDGQNFKNVDNSFDFMARGWISPTSFLGEGPLHDITLGGSYWTGNRSLANALANQTTAGGFVILNAGLPKLNMDNAGLFQQGRQHSYAFEVNAPIMHKFGLRWEFVHKNQPLSAFDTTTSATPTQPTLEAGLHLKGWSQYFELWGWLMGDDRIIGEPGMQMPTRYKKFGVKAPQHGLMLAARLELLDETLSADDPTGVGAPLTKANSYGKTKVTSYTLGANYWISKRFRTTFNWTLNHFSGDAPYITTGALKNAKNEQEFSFRLAIAL